MLLAHSWIALATGLAVLAGLACIAQLLKLGAERGRAVHDSAPFALRCIWPVLACLGWLVRPLMSAQWRHRFHARLERAGLERRLGPQHVVALQVCLTASGGAIVVTLSLLGMAGGTLSLIGAAALGVGWPLWWLRDTARRRASDVMRGLPFLIDLLVMSVEAGLPLSAAFAQSVERLPAGPLRDECRRVVRDVQAGRSRDEALRALAARLDIAGVTQLVMALSAAQRDGSGVVRVLRAQAEQQRNERFLRAEHRAAQAPVRMLFPLLVFIFPGTLAVLLFPVVSRLMNELGQW